MAPDLVDEVHEFVRAEGIGFNDAAPVRIESYRSVGTDAVAPVISVGKAAAGPPHVRNLQRLECSDDVVADAARVRDFGVRTDPDAVVNPVPEMLRELAEKIAVNGRPGLTRVDRDFNLVCRERRCGEYKNQQKAGKNALNDVWVLSGVRKRLELHIKD